MKFLYAGEIFCSLAYNSVGLLQATSPLAKSSERYFRVYETYTP